MQVDKFRFVLFSASYVEVHQFSTLHQVDLKKLKTIGYSYRAKPKTQPM